MSEPRRRLSPDERQEQLLDLAVDLIVSDGAAACTVEVVADRAGVTPQLVRRYFSSRQGLLERVYQRELTAHRTAVAAEVAAADGFEAIVRVFVRSNFRELSRFTALGHLRALPQLAATVPGAETGIDDASRVLFRAVRAEHDLDRQTAIQALHMGSAASIAAGNLYADRRGDEAAQVEATVQFVLAGVRALARED